MLDDEADAHQFAGEVRLHDPSQAVPHQPAGRLRDQGEDRELQQQDAQHLAAREAEYTQAGQLPRPLGQRYPGVVVDDAERDNGSETSVDARHRGDEQGDGLAEVRQRDALQRHAADRRHGLHRRVEVLFAVLVEAEVHAIHDGRLAHQLSERLDVHHSPDAEVVFDGRHDRHRDRSAGALQQIELDRITGPYPQDVAEHA
jgi:hypothetical protein